MKTVIKKWGNSLGVRIPSLIAQELHLEDGSQVEIARKDDGILISPGVKATLRKKLELITEDNIHSAVDTGKPVGKEAW